MWLAAEAAAAAPVSRAGLTAAGGSLGAGIVLPLDPGTCPLGEVAAVADQPGGPGGGDVPGPGPAADHHPGPGRLPAGPEARRAGGASSPAPGAARACPGPAGPGKRPDSDREIEGLVVTEAWIAQLGGDR